MGRVKHHTNALSVVIRTILEISEIFLSVEKNGFEFLILVYFRANKVTVHSHNSLFRPWKFGYTEVKEGFRVF